MIQFISNKKIADYQSDSRIKIVWLFEFGLKQLLNISNLNLNIFDNTARVIRG